MGSWERISHTSGRIPAPVQEGWLLAGVMSLHGPLAWEWDPHLGLGGVGAVVQLQEELSHPGAQLG